MGWVAPVYFDEKGWQMIDANKAGAKAAWVEPEVTTLEIDETALFPGVGADGSAFPDCTRS